MRRLLTWGCQEPLLCPAEASPPPPSYLLLPSAFHAPHSLCSANNNTASGIITLHSSSKQQQIDLLANIERFSAKLTGDDGLSSVLFGLPSTPQAATTANSIIHCNDVYNSGSSNIVQSTTVTAAATATSFLLQSGNNNNAAIGGTETTAVQTDLRLSAAAAAKQPNQQPLFVTTTDMLCQQQPVATAAQQQQEQQRQNVIHTATHGNTTQAGNASKGLDVFLAALVNSSPRASVDGAAASSTQQQQQQELNTNALAKLIAGNDNSNFGTTGNAAVVRPQQQQQSNIAGTQQQQHQQLADNIQAAVATTALANAVNAVNFMNAAIQQVQQHQQQNLASSKPTALEQVPPAFPAPSAAALMAANLKSPLSSTPSSALLQPIGQQQNGGNAVVGHAAALNSALQLAVAQQRHKLQQQQQNQFKGVAGPLSPEQIVQAGLPVLLTRMGAPNILRPPVPSQSKPIPLLEDKVDLLRFKTKEPREWSSDDVVAWVLDVARRHQIPCENINLAKFANCNGPLLMLMNEQSFKEHDPNYGTLLFSEFCKLVTDEIFIDEWMRCSSSNFAANSTSSTTTNNNNNAEGRQHQQQQLFVGHQATAVSSSSSAAFANNNNQTPSAQPMEYANNNHHNQQQQQQSASQLLVAAAAVNTNTTVGSFLAANLQSLQQKMGIVEATTPSHSGGPVGNGTYATSIDTTNCPNVGQQPPQQHQSNLFLAAAASIGKGAATGIPGGFGQLLSPNGNVAVVPPPPSTFLNLQQQQQQQHPNPMMLTQHAQQQQQAATFNNQQQQRQHQPPIASLSKMLQHQQQPESLALASKSGTNASRQQHNMTTVYGGGGGPGPSSGGANAAPTRRNSKLAEQKIRRNKDGRPRKRSQHTKGNKLWEFIRNALKDPRTCPSIVRWEDPSEGVFRIVESERLAFLWGQKKNNQKMTYEKLSRAMRTYYEKEILVPVPKSGLYPKKLVYKFGPSAMGWKVAASIAVQSQLVTTMAGGGGPNHHHQRI